MLSNRGAGDDSGESLGLHGDQTSQPQKEINPEYSFERLILKLKLQYLWPPDTKSRLTGKDPDAWKDGRQREKGAEENEMV